MPSGFIPNGMVANHSSPGSLSVQYCGDAMKASILPWEAASKHSNGCMICPPGKTSIRNRPPLVSSTIFPSLWVAPCSTSRDGVQDVDSRHWTFGWAITLGESLMAVATTAATRLPPVAMNLRRSLVMASSSPRDELVVGAFGHVVPWADQRLELREGSVNLSGHRCLLRFLSDNLCRELFEVAQHGNREPEHLDLALELRLESLESDGVPGVVLGETVDLDRCCRVIQSSPKLDGKGIVRFFVEAEVERGTGLVPTGVVVVPCRLLKTHLQVIVRTHPFRRVDDTPLESSIDFA